MSTHCSVPGCRRRSSKFKNEWLCVDHWRLVDRALKAFRTRHLRKLLRLHEKALAAFNVRNMEIVAAADPRGIHMADPVWALMTAEEGARRRWRVAEHTIWHRMKRQAIERAAGI